MVEMALFNIQKANNSKSRQNRVTVHVFCMSSYSTYICVKFGENILDGIRVMERIRMMEVLMDGHSKFRRVEHNTIPTFCGRA